MRNDTLNGRCNAIQVYQIFQKTPTRKEYMKTNKTTQDDKKRAEEVTDGRKLHRYINWFKLARCLTLQIVSIPDG